MLPPPIPENEDKRLTALKTYDILDSVAEEVFDQVTQSAAEVCQTPISLLSFIDKDRQWIKSSRGLDLKTHPRESSFCAHAINSPGSFTVENASEDERFRSNPLVTEQGIRFYAAKPLRTSDGLAIGTLCVIDRVPRKLTYDQEEALEKLADATMHLLELRKATESAVFAHAVNLVSDGLAIAAAPNGGEYRIIFVNKSFSTITGYAFHEAIDQHFAFPAQDCSVVAENNPPLRNFIDGKRPSTNLVLLTAKSGGRVHDRVRIYPYVNENSEVLCVVVAHQDVTQEREAERQRLQVAAMKTTMASVNHVVRNFMNSLHLYRLRMSSDRKLPPEVLIELDLIMKNALNEIEKISSLDEYKERLTGFGFKMLDV